MITKEDIRKEFLHYKKLDTLEPLFDILVATDRFGYTHVYSYEQFRLEYNLLVDAIGHYLEEIRQLDNQLEECMAANDRLINELYG